MKYKLLFLSNEDFLSEKFNIQNMVTKVRKNYLKFIKNNIEKLENMDTEIYPLLNAIKPFNYKFRTENIFIILVNEKNDFFGGIVLKYINDHSFEIKSISVEKEYQNNGWSLFLINKMFNFCSKIGVKTLYQSPYTPEGFKYTRYNFLLVSKKYENIKFIDEEKKLYPF